MKDMKFFPESINPHGSLFEGEDLFCQNYFWVGAHSKVEIYLRTYGM